MHVHASEIGPVVIALMNAQCYQATRFLSREQIIRVTKPRCHSRKKQWQRADRWLGFNLTIGKPNVREREFIKRHGVPEDIQLRDFPRSR